MFKPNSLVQYKGGGYDGCFWEWNYAFIDARGHFHDIYNSGYKGCGTREKLKVAYANHSDDFDIYCLADPAEAERFADEAPISHLLGVARWLHEHAQKIVLRPKCDECGERFDACEMCGEDPHGIGGIMQEYCRLLCPDHAEAFNLIEV